MKKNLTICIAAAAALIQFTNCSKAPEAPKQTQAPVRQTAIERIAEIDRLLAAPLTGNPDDANRRAVLRAERNALAGSSSTASNQIVIQQQQQARQAAQEAHDHQQMITQLKADAERSKLAEQRQLQAQRDQWEKEDRLSLRKQNGNYHPEAPPQNTYDIQIQRQRNRQRDPNRY